MSIRLRLGSFVLGVACARTPEQPATRSAEAPRRAPATTSRAAPEAVVPVPAPAVPSAAPQRADKAALLAAWTDPGAIEALVRDCNASPPSPSPGQSEPSPLACTSGLYEQSCIYDPCYSTDQSQCKPRCEKACDSCSELCSTACTRCKTRCSDEGCTRTCAATCGSCKQACLSVKDRCATGTCGAEYKACTEQLTTRWLESGCAKTCEAYRACTGKCQESPACAASAQRPEACTHCTDRCAASVKRGCPREFVELCLFNGAPP